MQVGEPSVEDTIQILAGIQPKYEEHHKVHYTKEAVEAAAKLSHRYLTGRFLPDKAIDILDEAGARKRVSQMTRPDHISEMEVRIEEIKERKDKAVDGQLFPGSRPPPRRGKTGQGRTPEHAGHLAQLLRDQLRPRDG